MRTKIAGRAAAVVFALLLLTVYVASSQRRHNQGAFTLTVAADDGGAKGAALPGQREMVAYGSKSGPVFVPESRPVKTNQVKATNSSKVKKSTKGTNESKATNAAVVWLPQAHDMVAYGSKSGVVFVPEDVKGPTTNGAAVNHQGR